MKKYTQQEMDKALEAHTATLEKRVGEMRKQTNENCLSYEPEICELCNMRDEIEAYNQALDDVIEAIKQPKEVK